MPPKRVWEDAHAAACGLRRAEDLGFGSPADNAKVRPAVWAKEGIVRSWIPSGTARRTEEL